MPRGRKWEAAIAPNALMQAVVTLRDQLRPIVAAQERTWTMWTAHNAAWDRLRVLSIES